MYLLSGRFWFLGPSEAPDPPPRLSAVRRLPIGRLALRSPGEAGAAAADPIGPAAEGVSGSGDLQPVGPDGPTQNQAGLPGPVGSAVLRVHALPRHLPRGAGQAEQRRHRAGPGLFT